MEALFNSLGYYFRVANYRSFEFWIFPVASILLIWLLVIVGLKVFPRRSRHFKTVYYIHKAWIISSLAVSAVIIGLICYWWSINYFSDHPFQISLILSLIISLLVPVLKLRKLRNYFTFENIKEITHLPKTSNKFDETIVFAKKAYFKNKLFYFILIFGFLFLLFSLSKGRNLISIVFDNSTSLDRKDAIEALSETLNNLENNNEIVLTTLDGLDEYLSGAKSSMDEIMEVRNHAMLKAGNVVPFSDPSSATSGLNQINNQCWGSPICESIWKSYLYIRDTKANNIYKNKLMIIVTDGDDDIGNSIDSDKFFLDDEEFAGEFPADKIFIVDYSDGEMNPLLEKFSEYGCDSYSVANDKQEYLDALDTALGSFKNNWHLIIWTIILTTIMVLCGIFIEPRKII